MSVTRLNAEYLLERGGAELSLLEKKIAIVGCGSVGSEIAVMLAKSGAGELTLIDDDMFDADNLYRHRLGGGALNFVPDSELGFPRTWRKVTALANNLHREIPFIKVIDIPESFEEAEEKISFAQYDLVVVAVGSPSISLMINQKLKLAGCKQVIYCWNEAASCGGHAVLLNLEESCLECLYSKSGGIEAATMLSLIQPGQDISKNMTGCAGVFTPFSGLDSTRSATLAAQLALDALLQGRLASAISWKGNNRSGLKVTERFKSMPLQEELPIIVNRNCGVCNE